jgi:hypothetical protein
MTATVEGAVEDPWGNERVGMSVRGTIDAPTSVSLGSSASRAAGLWSARR